MGPKVVRSESEACAEKDRLLLEYQRISNEMARTMTLLRSRLGVLQRTEYKAIGGRYEQLRLECEAAQRALEAHTSEHGC